MRNFRTLTLVPLLGAGLALAGCAGTDVDDPGRADSVMEVQSTTISPASAGGSVSAGTCVITVTNASSTLANKGKSLAGASATFNDIVVDSVTISYEWDNLALVTPTRTFQLGATIPAGGTASVQYPPIAFGDLTGAYIGHTANLDMVFHGTSVSGEPISANGGGALSVGGACSP